MRLEGKQRPEARVNHVILMGFSPGKYNAASNKDVIKQGSTIGGYTIEGVLDRNGSGPLYSGRKSNHKVIIGVLNSEDPILIGKYTAEAQSFAKLQHPSLSRIVDTGVGFERAYTIWEIPRGEYLATIERSRKFVPFEQKISAVVQIAAALQHIHASGLTHRNVTPKSIVIDAEGSAVLTKFEFAENQRAGRPVRPSYYSSPEQIRGRDTDGSSDQFSSAVVLYEWIAGKRPFKGASVPAALTEIISSPHVPLSEVLPACASELVQILDRALSKQIAGRYPSCKDFGEALQTFLVTLPRDYTMLQAEIERLKEEVFTGEQTLAALGIPFTPEPGIIIEPDRDHSDPRGQDYGALLARHGHLIRGLEALGGRLKSGLPILRLLQEAHLQMEDGDFEGCERTIRKLFTFTPDLLIGKRLLERCAAGQHNAMRRKAFEERSALLLEQIREAIERKQPSLSLLGTQAILEFEPKHADAMALRDSAERMLETQESGRKQRVKELLEMCRLRLRAGEYDAAMKVSEELFKLSPDLKDALDLQGGGPKAAPTVPTITTRRGTKRPPVE
jgi:serine/threonine protein kinase